MNTNINRVLFDYDGTLIIHDKENEAKQLADILGLSDKQRPLLKERLHTFFETSYMSVNERMTRERYLKKINKVIKPLQDFGVTPECVFDAIVEKSNTCSTLVKNAHETLEYLANKGYQLCIFTNGFYSEQIESMKYKGIYEYFEKVYAWDDFFYKPDTKAFFRALGGTSPEHNVMIGDSLKADIIPARQMGLYTIGINMPNLEGEPIKPDVVIRDLSELRTIL